MRLMLLAAILYVLTLMAYRTVNRPPALRATLADYTTISPLAPAPKPVKKDCGCQYHHYYR